jgi:hypothetical protein
MRVEQEPLAQPPVADRDGRGPEPFEHARQHRGGHVEVVGTAVLHARDREPTVEVERDEPVPEVVELWDRDPQLVQGRGEPHVAVAAAIRAMARTVPPDGDGRRRRLVRQRVHDRVEVAVHTRAEDLEVAGGRRVVVHERREPARPERERGRPPDLVARADGELERPAAEVEDEDGLARTATAARTPR